MAQTPADAINDMVLNSGVFPLGTSVVNLTATEDSVTVDLSTDVFTGGFGDSQSDAYVEAINDALTQWPEITNIEVTVGGFPLWTYLPPPSDLFGSSGGRSLMSLGGPGDVSRSLMAAQGVGSVPVVTPLSSELTGKLVVLHPSHGSYFIGTTWYRAQRTLCGPNPVTNRPPGMGAAYQPSDYYYWTKGFSWPMYYEDDMSPETIRFLYAYCKAGGAATYCSRNLNKSAGAFPATSFGYPATSYPRWQVASKYNLQDIGLPQSVWDEPALPLQADKDLRARAYYVNYLMQTLGYNYNNTVSFSLHSNAATTGSPIQSQARGTETYWYIAQYPTEQAKSAAYCTAVENGVISAIRSQYDGTWAEAIYNATTTPVPQEWSVPYGTYRGYKQGTADANARWQDRGVKTSNFGEIREVKAPAQLMELLFHDDWKFYPDQAFHQDKIFRATIAWGMYTGICNFFAVTPKPYLGATVDSVSFPAYVLPGAAVNGTVSMKNQGMAWCWGNKQVGTAYNPYTVWNLQATAADQFGVVGTKIYIANDGNYYPGDTAEFAVSLTAPAETGTYTTSWKMVKDGFAGGAFGAVASAQIGVDGDGPEITIAAPEAKWYNADPITVSFSATDAMSGLDTITANVNGTDIVSGDSVSGLGNGIHTLSVSAKDKLGNESTKSVNFNVDKDAPVITITAPLAQIYAGKVITPEFSAVDSLSGVASVTAALDGSEVTSGVAVSGLASGLHTLAVTAVDNVGNTATQTVVFTMDSTPPVITIVSPEAKQYLQAGGVLVSFGAVDDFSGVASISATMDGAAIGNGTTYSLLWAPLGTHTLVVTAVDGMGNSTAKSVTFTIGATLESIGTAINQLYAGGQIDNEGIQNSLLVKLAKYEKDTGDIVDAKNYLKNFINEVNAQSGKHLTVAAANILLADAQYVIAHLPTP